MQMAWLWSLPTSRLAEMSVCQKMEAGATMQWLGWAPGTQGADPQVANSYSAKTLAKCEGNASHI